MCKQSTYENLNNYFGKCELFCMLGIKTPARGRSRSSANVLMESKLTTFIYVTINNDLFSTMHAFSITLPQKVYHTSGSASGHRFNSFNTQYFKMKKLQKTSK